MRQQQEVDYSQFSVGELVDHVLNQLKIETDSAQPQERRFAARSGIDEVLNAISPMAVHPNQEIARAISRLERTVALHRNRIEPKFEDGRPISALQLANDPAAKAWLRRGEHQDKYIGVGSFDDTMLPTGGTAGDLADSYDPVAGFLTGKHDEIVADGLNGVADLDEAAVTQLGIDKAALGTRVDPRSSELLRRALIYGGDVQEENGRKFIQSPDGERLPLPDLSVGRKVSAALGDGSRAEFTITDAMIDRLNEASGRNFLSNTIAGGLLDSANQNLSMVHGIQANFHDIEVLTPYGKRRVPRLTGNAAVDSEIYQMPEFQRASELLAPERGLAFSIGQSIYNNVEYGGLMFLTSLGLKGAGKAAQKLGLGMALSAAESAFAKNRMSSFAKMTASRIGKAIVEGGRQKGNWMAPGMRYDAMQLGEEVYYNVVRDAVNGRWEPKKAFSEGVSEWAGEFVLSRTARALRRVGSRVLDTKAMRGIGERMRPVVTDNSAFEAAMKSVDAARKAGSDKLVEAAKRGMFGEVGRHMRAEQLGQMFDSWFVGHSFGAWSAAQQMAAAEGRDWDHMSLGDKTGYFMQGTVSAEALGSGIGMIGTQVGYTSLSNGVRNPVRALFDPEYIAANSGNPEIEKTADDMAQFLLHITGQQEGDLDPNVVTLIDGVWDFEATGDEKAARLQRLADTVRGNEPLTEPELAARDIDAELNTISIEQIASLFDRENGPEVISAAAARLTGEELADQAMRARTEITALSADPAELAQNSERITKLRQYSDVLVDELSRRARGEAGGRGQTEEVEWVDEEGEVIEGPFNEEPNPMSLPDANDLKTEELGQFFSEGIEKLEDGRKIRTWTVKAPKWRNAGRSAYSQTTIYQATDGQETFLTFDLNKDIPDPTFPNTPAGLEAAMRAATVAAGVLTADDRTRVQLGRKPLTEAGRILAGLKPKTGPAQLLASLLNQPELQKPSTVLKLETLDRGDPEQGVMPGSVSMLIDAIRQDADGRRSLREAWRNAIYRNVLESRHRDPREQNPIDVLTEERIERDLRRRVRDADADIKRKDKEIASQNARAAKDAARAAKSARSAEAELERERKKLEREQRLRDKIEEREDAKSKLEKLKAELRAAKEATKRVRAEAKLAKDRLKLEREKLKLEAVKPAAEASAAVSLAVKLEEKAKAEKKKARKERAATAKATAEAMRASPTPASTGAATVIEKTAETVNKISEVLEAVGEKADKKAVEEGRTDPPTQLELDSMMAQIQKALGEIEYVNAEKREAAEAAVLSSSRFMSMDGLRKQLQVLTELAKKSKAKRSKAPEAAPVQTLSAKRNRGAKADRVRKKATEQIQQAKEAVQELADAGRPVDPAVEQKIMAVANEAAAQAEAAAAKLDPATEAIKPGTNPLREMASVQMGAELFTGRARARKVGVGSGENIEPGRMFETLLLGFYTQLEGAVDPEAKAKHTGMVAGFIIGAGLTKGSGKGTTKEMHRAIGDLFGMSADEVEQVRSALELQGAVHDDLIMQRLAAIKSDKGDPLIDLERAKKTWLPALRIIAVAPEGTIPERGRGALIADGKAAHMMRGWWQQAGRSKVLEAAKQYAERNGKSFDAGQMAETIDRLWEARMARISILSGQGKSKADGGKQEPKQFTPIVSQVVNMISESYLGKDKRNVNDSFGIRIGGEIVQLRDVAVGVIESIRTGRTLESVLELTVKAPTEQGEISEQKPASAEDMSVDADVAAAVESIDPVDTVDPMQEAARNAHHHYNIAQRTLEDFNELVVKQLGMEVPIGDMDKVTTLLRDANEMFLEGGDDVNGLSTPDTENPLFKAVVLTITKDDSSEEKALQALDTARDLCSMARRISAASQEAAVQMIAASIPVDSESKGKQVELMQDRVRLGFFMHSYAAKGGDDEKVNAEIIETCKSRFGFSPFDGDEKQPVVAVHAGGKTVLRPGKAFAARTMKAVYGAYADVLKRMGLHMVGARDRTGKVQQPMTYMFGGFPATPEMAKTFVHFLAGVVNFSTGYGSRVFGLDARSLADSDVLNPAWISPKRLLESMNRGDAYWTKTADGKLIAKLATKAIGIYQKYWIGYRGVRGLGTARIAESNEKLIGSMNSANFEANEMMARAQKLMRTAREWNLHTSEYRLMGDLLAHGAVTRFRNAGEFEKATGRKGSGRLYDHMVEWNKLLMEMGQQMVELGIISPEQFAQRENEYLPKRMVQLAYGEGGLNYFVNSSEHSGGDPVSASEKHTTTDEGGDFSVRMYDIRYTMPVTVARVAKRIELFRALHQMRREGVVLTKADFEALTPIEKAQYTRLANRGLDKTMDGQMVAQLTREEETDLAEGRMSPVEKDRLLEERRSTTLEAAMVQTMIDEERKSRVENNIAHPRMMELLDSLEGGYVTWHALREISFMLERTETNGPMSSDTISVLADKAQQVSVEWRQLRTVQNPRHWMLQFFTNLATNAISGKVPIGDMLTSLTTGEGTYADAAWAMTEWHQQKSQGVKREDMSPEAAEFDAFVEKMGGATLSHLINDPVRPSDLILSMFYNADGTPLYGTGMTEALAEAGGVPVALSRAGRGHANYSTSIRNLSMSANPAARAEAIRGLVGIYNLHELWWKYAATIEGQRRGLSLDAAVRWGAEGTGDFSDRNTTLMRMTTSFTMGTSRLRDKAYGRVGAKQGGLNKRLMARQLISMGVATPFWMYRASMIPTMARYSASWRGVLGAAFATLGIRIVGAAFGGDDEDLLESSAGSEILRDFDPNDQAVEIFKRRHGMAKLPGFGGGGYDNQFAIGVGDWIDYWKAFGNNLMRVGTLGIVGQHDVRGEMLTAARGPTVGGGSTMLNMRDFVPMVGEVNDLSAGDMPFVGTMFSGRKNEAHDSRYGFGLMASSVTAGVVNLMRLYNGEEGKTRANILAEIASDLSAQLTAPMGGSTFLPAAFSKEYQVLYGETAWDGRSFGEWTAGLPRARQESTMGEALALVAARSTLPVVRINSMSRAPRLTSQSGRPPQSQIPEVAAAEQRNSEIRSSIAGLFGRAYRESLDDPTVPHAARVSSLLDLSGDLVATPGGGYDVLAQPRSELGRWLRARGSSASERWPWVRDTLDALEASRSELDRVISGPDGLVYRRDVDPALHDRMVRAVMRKSDNPTAMMRFIHQQLREDDGRKAPLLARLWVTTGAAYERPTRPEDLDMWDWANKRVQEISRGSTIDLDTSGMPTDAELRSIVGSGVYDVSPEAVVRSRPRKSAGELAAKNPFPNLTR